jgi:predicted  nucleic acid-binding Zn-ribbon protein
MYEAMDIPKFMLAFEQYREERWQTLKSIRENTHLEFKAMGDGTRSSKKDDLDEHFFNMADKLHTLNNSLKEAKKENKKLRKEQ